MASISINWSDLGQVAEVAGAFAIGIVLVFTIGVLGLSRWESARSPEGGGRAQPLAVALSGLCFLACAAAAAFGIYLIVPQWGG